jgi:RNA polymerase sigma-70 factor (ECF subfamily)
LPPVIGTDFKSTLADAQDGDEAAFTSLFRDVQPALLRYLRVLAPEAAEDVASETWLRVVNGLTGFSGDEDSFRAWLFTIARRQMIDWQRSRARHRTVPLADSEAQVRHAEAELRQAAPDAADLALERISTESAMALVAALPAEQAEIIVLRVVAGLDTLDVSRIVGKTPGAVRVAAHRGLRRLAARLDRAGVTR